MVSDVIKTYKKILTSGCVFEWGLQQFMFDRENDAKPVEPRAFATESHGGGQLILRKGCKVEIRGEKSNSTYEILENLEKNIVHRSTIHESEILGRFVEYF